MLRVLIVEDDSTKLQRVLSTVLACEGVDREMVSTARDVSTAKRALRSTSFDLLVLDIMLPETEDLPPQRDAGLRLLRELFDRPGTYRIPAHIIGLTAFEDTFESASTSLAIDLWYALRYEAASDAWCDGLKRRIKHIALARQSAPEVPDYKYDLCVVTALHDPELAAVLRIPWGWEQLRSADPTDYYTATFEAGNAKRSVIAASAGKMGMAASASLSAKLIERFRPRYIAMVGIAAGLRERTNLGDVLVAEYAWDWGSGKLHRSDGQPGFSPAPHQIGPEALVLGRLGALSRDSAVLEAIRSRWPNPPNTPLRMHIGPLASGAAVIADSDVTSAIARHDRKIIGVEMEAFGVFTAARESSLPVPSAFCLKSVCDFADDKKDDRFQAYAAFTSAELLRTFSERYLFGTSSSRS